MYKNTMNLFKLTIIIVLSDTETIADRQSVREQTSRPKRVLSVPWIQTFGSGTHHVTDPYIRLGGNLMFPSISRLFIRWIGERL